MTDAVAALIVPLSAEHSKDGFDCGNPALNRYLTHQLGQDIRRNVAKAYVLQLPGDPNIVGYYTLAATSVLLKDLPEDVTKKLPRYPDVPTTLLGRLAVSSNYKGRKFGEQLLIDALLRSQEASQSVASVAVVVDAKDEAGASFYRKYGFQAFPENPLRLFMQMGTINKLFGKPTALPPPSTQAT